MKTLFSLLRSLILNVNYFNVAHVFETQLMNLSRYESSALETTKKFENECSQPGLRGSSFMQPGNTMAKKERERRREVRRKICPLWFSRSWDVWRAQQNRMITCVFTPTTDTQTEPCCQATFERFMNELAIKRPRRFNNPGHAIIEQRVTLSLVQRRFFRLALYYFTYQTSLIVKFPSYNENELKVVCSNADTQVLHNQSVQTNYKTFCLVFPLCFFLIVQYWYFWQTFFFEL